MTFFLERGKQQDALQSPPIWSLLIYMLLTESLNLHDRILRENLRLPHPSGDQSLLDLESSNDTQGLRQSGTVETTKGADKRLSHAGKLTEVGWQPFFFLSHMALMNLFRFQGVLSFNVSMASRWNSRALTCPHPNTPKTIVLLYTSKRNFGGGWSSVYASSKSHIVFKFGVVPKKDKVEVERQLINEKTRTIS
jgi:hypothetical protein